MGRVADGAWWPRRAALGCTLPLAAALALPLVPLTLDGYLPVAQALWAPSAILAVVAVVVPAGEPPTLDALRDLVEPRAWAPRALVLADALPRTDRGKVDLVAVRELAR